MDIFIEQIVKKIPSLKETLLKVGIVLLAIVLSLASFLVPGMLGLSGLSMISMLLAVGCVYGAYFLISGFNVEYEYIVTNGEIDIDKISAKQRRKRLITARVSSFEKFGLLKDADKTVTCTTIIASIGNAEEDYYAEFNHSKHGHVRLLFSPNERVLTAIRPFMPRTIR